MEHPEVDLKKGWQKSFGKACTTVPDNRQHKKTKNKKKVKESLNSTIDRKQEGMATVNKKILIAEETYAYLDNMKLVPEEQKGCRRQSRGAKDQLLIDKTVLKDCKKKHTNLCMAWMDYKKAFALVLHSWINECMEIFGIAENVRNFLRRSMEHWKLWLTSNGEVLGEVDVKRGIFQGDSLSPLLFVQRMIPLSFILRKINICYEWGKKEYKLNNLLFMDDLKLCSKSEMQIETLVETV